MTKVFSPNSANGSKHGPKSIGDILNEMLQSDELLAAGFRKHKAGKTSKAGKAFHDADETIEGEAGHGCLFTDLFPNTELSVDLKIISRRPGQLDEGKMLAGVITRDDYDHYTFMENAPKHVAQPQRNPHVYLGHYINVNRGADGKPYPTFCRPAYTKNFRFEDFCRLAADELYVVAGLVEKKSGLSGR